jgi:hypothetical protein
MACNVLYDSILNIYIYIYVCVCVCVCCVCVCVFVCVCVYCILPSDLLPCEGIMIYSR